jgi:hypothetical protein
MWPTGLRAETRTPGPPDYEAGVPNTRRRRLATFLMQICNYTPKQSNQFGYIRYILFSPVSSVHRHRAYRFFPCCKPDLTSSFFFCLNHFQCNHLSSDHVIGIPASQCIIHSQNDSLSLFPRTIHITNSKERL